jgi:hypothetical protein
METKEDPRVEFGAGRAAVATTGLMSGAAIAVGLPAVVLGLGHALTATMQLWLVVLALVIGGLTCLTAAFFGTVMPSAVGGQWHPPHESRCGREPKTEAGA